MLFFVCLCCCFVLMFVFLLVFFPLHHASSFEMNILCLLFYTQGINDFLDITLNMPTVLRDIANQPVLLIQHCDNLSKFSITFFPLLLPLCDKSEDAAVRLLSLLIKSMCVSHIMVCSTMHLPLMKLPF